MNSDTTLRKTRWGGLALLTHQGCTALVIQVMQCWFCNRHRGQWHRLEGPNMDTTIDRDVTLIRGGLGAGLCNQCLWENWLSRQEKN